MWYFAWILGLPLAAIFAVMNAMWLELKEHEATIALGHEGAASKRSRR
ncbi:cytochrome bd-I oxidase subunit CydX [Rhodobacter sp. Har01]|nr:cytochrome bd-I oxidase subunit CydX [Rhodobacter sp. Har01]MCB6178087.1 cytochrome bd-I oxidase subunit CydX [Rhodobacter sp. Har01]